MMMLILMQMLMIVGLDTLCDNLGRQNCMFLLDVIKFQTKEWTILLFFYLHEVLEKLKFNI